MHFLSCQSVIMGPKILFDSSHRCHLSDDLAKQPADTSKKGVVGNSGKNTPIIPNPKKMKPSDLKSGILLSCISNALWSIKLIFGSRTSTGFPSLTSKRVLMLLPMMKSKTSHSRNDDKYYKYEFAPGFFHSDLFSIERIFMRRNFFR